MLLPGKGERPAYNITKEQIEQLRETGLCGYSIAELLGVSEKNPSTTKNMIWNSVMMCIIMLDILQFTPYSDKSHVREGFEPRQINVKRCSVRASIQSINPIDRNIKDVCNLSTCVQCL